MCCGTTIEIFDPFKYHSQLFMEGCIYHHPTYVDNQKLKEWNERVLRFPNKGWRTRNNGDQNKASNFVTGTVCNGSGGKKIHKMSLYKQPICSLILTSIFPYEA